MSTSCASAKARRSASACRCTSSTPTQSPGVKRGGAVNIVTHAIPVRCPADRIPQSIDVDVAGLEINNSKHLSDVEAAGRREADRARAT